MNAPRDDRPGLQHCKHAQPGIAPSLPRMSDLFGGVGNIRIRVTHITDSLITILHA